MPRKLLSILFALSLFAVPAAFAQSTCSSEGTLEEIMTTFANDTNTNITIHWINTECVEQDGTPIAAGGELEFTTYDGHEFVFRNPNGDALLNYGVNTLIADESVSIKQTISEGAAVGPQFEVINPARAELGFQPLYFSDALYNAAEQAALQFEADLVAAGSNVDAITNGTDLTPLVNLLGQFASEQDLAVVGSSAGVRLGELASTETLASIITASAQETEQGSSWLNSTAQSFAVYADEHVFLYVFSSKSQPELDAALSAETPANVVNPVNAIVTLTGELSSEAAMNTFSFEAEANVVHVFWLRSNDFDTYVRLYDADNNEVAANDDIASDNSNSFVMYVVPAAGWYTVSIDSFVEGASGQYTLSITHTTTVALDSLTQENLSKSFTFDFEEGETYFVSAESATFDTILNVLDPSGAEIAANDDRGDGSTHSLVWFTAPSTGAYTVNVTSFENTGVGAFSVFVGAFAPAQ